MPEHDFTQKAIAKYLEMTSYRSMRIEYGQTETLNEDAYKELEFDVYEDSKTDTGWDLRRKIANIKNCMDLALATGDRDWFDKLHKRYKPLLKSENTKGKIK